MFLLSIIGLSMGNTMHRQGNTKATSQTSYTWRIKVPRIIRQHQEPFCLCSEEWLKRMDQNLASIKPIMESTYGKDSAVKWTVYWRTFFIAVAELFGYNNGEEWMVTLFLFKKKWCSQSSISVPLYEAMSKINASFLFNNVTTVEIVRA